MTLSPADQVGHLVYLLAKPFLTPGEENWLNRRLPYFTRLRELSHIIFH